MRIDRLVVASQNPDKISEIEHVLVDLPHPIEVVRGLSWPEIEETEDTLEGNALLKAATVAELTGIAALADDTGLEVKALDGAPGVYSARYAGERATYDDNVDKLLEAMSGVADRAARFRTAMAIVTPSGEKLVVEGVLDGSIGEERRGDGGFGYDPVFVVDHRTLAEMEPAEKNAISHRGRALRALAGALESDP